MNLPTNTTNRYFLCAFYIINLLLVYTNIYLFTLNEQFTLSNQRQARMSGLPMALPVSTSGYSISGWLFINLDRSQTEENRLYKELYHWCYSQGYCLKPSPNQA